MFGYTVGAAMHYLHTNHR